MSAIISTAYMSLIAMSKVLTAIGLHVLRRLTGAAEPESFFINSKALESFQWITSLMTSFHRRMADPINTNSMVGPVDVRAMKRIRILSIINDMKETFDPNGSYIIPDGSGREVHSVVHHMGLILEYHLELLDKIPDS